MALFNPCMKFEIFWSIVKMAVRQNIHNMPQGLAKSRICAGKSTKKGFSKKALTEIEKYFLFSVRTNTPQAWNTKLEAASFFTF